MGQWVLRRDRRRPRRRIVRQRQSPEGRRQRRARTPRQSPEGRRRRLWANHLLNDGGKASTWRPGRRAPTQAHGVEVNGCDGDTLRAILARLARERAARLSAEDRARRCADAAAAAAATTATATATTKTVATQALLRATARSCAHTKVH